MRILCWLLLAQSLLAGPLPRFLQQGSKALTAPSGQSPRAIAEAFTAAQTVAAGLTTGPSLYLAREYRTEFNGVTHLAYRQRFQGLDVYQSEWVVNIDAEGQVISAGGNLYPAPAAAGPDFTQVIPAAQVALAAVNPVLAAEATVARAGLTKQGHLRFSTSGAMGELTARGVWYPFRNRLLPAFEFEVVDGDGVSAYSTVVDAKSLRPLAKSPLSFFQAPQGQVFTGISPQPSVALGVRAEAEPPFVSRTMVSFAGDPAASRTGWVRGAMTRGNNAVVGVNPLGLRFAEPEPVAAVNGAFSYPLTLGAGAPNPRLFPEAAVTNLFYWVNRSHDLFYSYGFDEAAGNFQTSNSGFGGVDGDPMFAYAHFGAASSSGFPDLNNAFYSVRGSLADGAQPMIAMYLTSHEGIWADGSYAADVIMHEYTHGVTLRLIPTLSGFQGGAINEALSDFWALEFLLQDNAPADGVYTIGDYAFRAFGRGIRSRPYTTNQEINPLTYADFGRATSSPSVHNDGGIWVMALWEVRANLIRQFGDREGRRRLRQIVLDGMKLAPPAPSMVDLRDAILLAERIDFRGQSQAQLWEGFAKRGLGALAYSPSNDSIQMKASFDVAAKAGAVDFLLPFAVAGQVLPIVLADRDLSGGSVKVEVTTSSGDWEEVVLTRDGNTYTGGILITASGPATRRSGALSVARADSVSIYYNDADSGAGFRQVQRTVPVLGNYALALSTTTPYTFPNERSLNFRASPGSGSVILRLPFPFPFYDKVYREVRVFPEGYLRFDVGNPPACYDQFSFNNATAIFPMAAWLRTNGISQPNQGVFISDTPNSLTIRWVGETVPLVYAPPLTPDAEPVNFAVTLQANGEIRFQYGDVNQNVLNGPPFGGCASTAPAVGISRGDGDTVLQPAVTYGRVNFRNAPAVTLTPPFGHATEPKVRLETPAATGSTPGLVTIQGLAWDEDVAMSSVAVLVDGVFQGNAAINQPRPDVCAAERLPGCPFIGFSRVIDPAVANLAPGTHELQLRAVNAKGGMTVFPAEPLRFTVDREAGPLPRVVVEAPAEGAEVSGLVTVRGYAYSATRRITSATLVIDGVVYGNAVLGQNRAALCAAGAEAAGSPNCPNLGWQAQVNTAAAAPALENGLHRLQIRITEEGGRVTLLPDTPLLFVVKNTVNQLPAGVVSSPTNAQRVSGVINVTGYAWDPDGRITTAQLIVNNVVRATLTYGAPAAEACAALRDVPACPNIGFVGTFDTRVLQNGLYRLAVRLVDNSNGSALIPGLTTAGMNIVVDNP